MSKEVDITLYSPFTSLVCGPTGSGKTELIFNLIRKRKEISFPPPVEVIYCYGVWQEKFREIEGEVTFHSGMVDLKTYFAEKDLKENRWLIIDDLMDKVGGDEEGEALFTKYSHHMNISVFFIVQNLFKEKTRTISLNSHYFFLFQNPRDSSSITNLAKQSFPNKLKFVQEAYADATSRPFSYLFINFKQYVDQNLRLIGNYASNSHPMTAYLEK